MSNLLSDHQTARELGVSVRTLRRWEEKGYFSPQKLENTNIRLYHTYAVGYLKRILDLDRNLKKHLHLLDVVKKELDEHSLVQNYIPGKPLKLMTEEDVAKFSRAHEAMERWEKEFKRLLDELTQYPNKILQTTVENYENQ
jgi:DNA-binding transcriptional MerR regulator